MKLQSRFNQLEPSVLEKHIFGADCVATDLDELTSERGDVVIRNVLVHWKDGSSAAFSEERVKKLFDSARPLFEEANVLEDVVLLLRQIAEDTRVIRADMKEIKEWLKGKQLVDLE